MSRFKLMFDSFFWAAVIVLTFAHSSLAAVTLNTNPDGELTGASGISVGNQLFDVSFVDGSARDLFGGSSWTFFFTTTEDAEAASIALLEQVFNTNPLYDNDPSLTYGIEDSSFGGILTPFAYYLGHVQIWRTENSADNEADTVTATIAGKAVPTSSQSVYAKWRVSEHPVPIPGAFLVLGFGLLGISGINRHTET